MDDSFSTPQNNDLSFNQDTNKTYKISNQLFHHNQHSQQTRTNIFS